MGSDIIPDADYTVLVAQDTGGGIPADKLREIALNGWLTADASHDLVFDMDDAEKWGAALASLGVDPLTLSASAGHA